MTEPRVIRTGIREDRPFYNTDTPRWWQSERQRLVVLEFETPEQARLWDEAPDWQQLMLWEGKP